MPFQTQKIEPFKSLIIGCGNIGALYDFDTENILTHAKAYFLHPNFEATVFDTNEKLAQQIAKRYNFKTAPIIDADILRGYDCISICSPTQTHFEILKQTFEAGVKVIICEKPVSNNVIALRELRKLYTQSQSKVIVNYIRRFQPAFIALKKIISDISEIDSLTNISIRYQRGFINNCSHAFDLIEYLTDSALILSDIQKHNFATDHFQDDPTLSIQGFANNINISILGLSHIQFSHFEIDLYFRQHKISILDAGQIIKMYHSDNRNAILSPLQLSSGQQEDCLKDYMKPVIDHVYSILRGSGEDDNFLQAINLNERMLNYLNN